MKKVINGTYKIDCMSDSFFGKFDLYDFLVVLVPGCAIGYGFGQCDKVADCMNAIFISNFFKDEVVLTLAFLVFAYLLGLLNHSVQNFLWPVLRNYKPHIEFARNGGSECSLAQINCLVIRGAYLFVVNVCLVLRGLCPCKVKHVDVDEEYLKSYYRVEDRPRSSVGYLEYQVMFLRNMLMPLAVLCFKTRDIACVAPFIVYYLMIERQEKIYKCIVEDAKFYKGKEDK